MVVHLMNEDKLIDLDDLMLFGQLRECDEATERAKYGGDMAYKYGMRLRGFSPMCQPMDGLIEVRDGEGRYHDILIYNRKLTEKEIQDYELDYIGTVRQ